MRSVEDFDLRDPEIARDPYPAYEWLRQRAPFEYSNRLKGWVITRFDDAVSVLQDAAHFSSELLDPDILATVTNCDPPRHASRRRAVTHIYGQSVRASAERSTQVSEDLAQGLLEQTRCDIIERFAYPLPLTVVSAMLGLPEDRDAELKRWSGTLVRTIGPLTGGFDFEFKPEMVADVVGALDFFLGQASIQNELGRAQG